MVSAAALAFLFHVRPRWNGPSPEALLTGIFIACVVLNLALPIARDQPLLEPNRGWTAAQEAASDMLTWPGIAIRMLMSVALLLAASYLSKSAGCFGRARFAALVLIAIAARTLIVLSVPSPPIDVFISQTVGGRGLIAGKNVYEMKFPSPYKEKLIFEVIRNNQKVSLETEFAPASAAQLGYELNSEARVTAIAPSSAAEAAGVKPGDLIAKITSQPCTFTHFGYPPSVVYCNGLSWLLFRDVRGIWIVFDVAAALLMYAVARRCNPGERGVRLCQLLPLTFLFLPRSLYVIDESWTEPLVLISMAGLALAIQSRRPALTGGLLGLWLCSKQYTVLAIPMILKLRRWRLITWICAVAVGLALVLPFAIWDFHAMMENVLYFFLKSDARADALSLYGFAVALGASASAGWIGAAVACLWIGGVAWFTWKMPRNLPGMLFAAAGMWIFFFLLGKQAFMNYFHMVAFTLLLAVAASREAAGNQVVGKPDESSSAR